MFNVMFWNANDKALYIKGRKKELSFDTHEEAYKEAEQLLLKMCRKGAVKMTIDHLDGSTRDWYEYPILDD